MAVIKNIIQTVMQVKGAKQTVAATNQVTKAQTRLGQQSASAGKQFSSQAAGLGGLVAAYAGAAATVFALQQAFSALTKAARAETILRGTRALALAIGQNANTLLANVEKITQGQLELSEAAENVNIALSAGFNTKQIEDLTKVSLKASRALGRNLTDALQRVIRGASKLEPELLDELGIFTRIDPAVEKYANKLNLATSSLTNYEKRQAFVNAVIEEGQRKFDTIDVSSGSAQKSFEQLEASLISLALGFGQLLGNVLVPFANFFRDDIGNQILLFGGILALIFGKAATLIGSFVTNQVKNLEEFSKVLAQASVNTRSLTEANQKLIATQKQIGANAFKGARAFAIPKGLQTEAAAAKARFLSDDTISFDQQKKDLGTLKEVIKLERTRRIGLEKGSDAFKNSTNRIRGAEAATKAYGIATANAGRQALFFSQAATVLSKSIAVLGVVLKGAFSIIVGLIGILSVVHFVGTLFDKDVIGALKEAYDDFVGTLENVKQGVIAISSSDPTGIKNITDEFIRLGASETKLESIGDRFSDITNEAIKTTRVIKIANDVILQSFNLQQEQFKREDALAAELGNTVRRDPDDFVIDPGITTFGEGVLAQLKKIRLESIETGDIFNQLATEVLIERFSLIDASLISIAGTLSRTTGIPSNEIGELLAEGFIKADVAGNRLLLVINDVFVKIGELDASREQFTLSGLFPAEAVDSATIFEKTFGGLVKDFKAGSIDAEKFSQKTGGLGDQLQNIKDIVSEEILTVPPIGRAAFRDILDLIAEMEKRLGQQSEVLRGLKQVEAIGLAISKTFSSALSAVDKIVEKGNINIFTGKLAETAKEAAKNQLEFLSITAGFAVGVKNAFGRGNVIPAPAIERIKELKEALETSPVERDARQNNLVQNRDKALKAAAGTLVQIVQDTKKLLDSETKRKVQLEKQIALLDAQLALKAAQNKLAEIQADNNAEFKITSFQLGIDKLRLENLKKRNDLLVTNGELAKERVKVLRDTLDLSRDILNNQLLLEAAQKRNQKERTLISAEADLENTRFFPNLVTDKEIQDRELVIAGIKHANALIEIAEQKRLIDLEFTNTTRQIEERRQDLEIDLAIVAQKKDNQKIAHAEDLRILKQEQALEITKINNENEVLEQRKLVADAQEQLAKIGAEQQKAERDFQIGLVKERVEILIAQREMVLALADALGPESAFVKAVQELIFLETGDFKLFANTFPERSVKDIAVLQDLIKDIEGLSTTVASKQAELATLTADSQRKVLQTQINANNKILKLIKERNKAQIESANIANIATNKDLMAEQLNLETKIASLEKDIEIAAQVRGIKQEDLEQVLFSENAKLQAVKDRVSAERNIMRQLFDDISDILQTRLAEGIRELNRAVLEGTLTLENFKEGFIDFIRETLFQLQEATLEEFIIKPLQEGIKGFFGIETAPDGTLTNWFWIKDVNNPTGITPSIGADRGGGLEALGEIDNVVETFFGKITGLFGELGTFIGDMFAGPNGLFSFLSDTLGSILGGISGGFGGFFSSIGSFFGFAKGGKIDSKDTIPAMLAPGEFVLRKEAVDRLGVGFVKGLNEGTLKGFAGGGDGGGDEGAGGSDGGTGSGGSGAGSGGGGGRGGGESGGGIGGNVAAGTGVGPTGGLGGIGAAGTGGLGGATGESGGGIGGNVAAGTGVGPSGGLGGIGAAGLGGATGESGGGVGSNAAAGFGVGPTGALGGIGAAGLGTDPGADDSFGADDIAAGLVSQVPGFVNPNPAVGVVGNIAAGIAAALGAAAAAVGITGGSDDPAGETTAGQDTASGSDPGESGRGRASGGLITRLFASGGLADSVPALLKPGEFVVKDTAVKKIGVDRLRAINAGVSDELDNRVNDAILGGLVSNGDDDMFASPQGFQTGGLVKGAGGGPQIKNINVKVTSSNSTKVIRTSSKVNVNVINNGTPQEVEDSSSSVNSIDPDQLVVNIVLKDIENNGPIRRQIRGLRT